MSFCLFKYEDFSTFIFFFILEIERVQSGGKINSKDDRKLVDVIKNKPLRLAAKVVVPVRDHPKVNIIRPEGMNYIYHVCVNMEEMWPYIYLYNF